MLNPNQAFVDNSFSMSKLLFQRVETTFGSLLRELQQIWEEIGENEADMDKTLSELEQECLQVYRRRVEQASHERACLHQVLAQKEAELASLFATLGERPQLSNKIDKKPTSLKCQIAAIVPQLEELTEKKDQRMQQFAEIKTQIQKITAEIQGSSAQSCQSRFPDDQDNFSLRTLEDYHAQLKTLQKEKSERLRKVLDHVNKLHELCCVFGMDFGNTINDVHPSLSDSNAGLQTKSISNETLETLSAKVQSLTTEKTQRIQTLSSAVSSLTELWILMETPQREQRGFLHLTSRPVDFSTPGGLSFETIEQVQQEVKRLEQLKASKMKDLVLRKRVELEQVCRQAHMEPDPSTSPEKTNALIDSGMVDASELLANLEALIAQAQEEALNRKDILDRFDKWVAACEEERWLEDYNMDVKRFNATRGAHFNLKRAERARITVTKLPGLVDGLIARTKSWEEEKGTCFLFDGSSLLSMLDDYTSNRHEQEGEKRRMRGQKKLQDQYLIEQEALFGSKSSPIKANGNYGLTAKANGYNGLTARRLSRHSMPSTPSTPSTPRHSMSMRFGTPEPIPRSNSNMRANLFVQNGKANRVGRPTAPLNFVVIQKEDNGLPFSPGGSDSSSTMGSTVYA